MQLPSRGWRANGHAAAASGDSLISESPEIWKLSFLHVARGSPHCAGAGAGPTSWRAHSAVFYLRRGLSSLPDDQAPRELLAFSKNETHHPKWKPDHPSVFVSWGCHNKEPQPGWFEQ